MIIDEIAEIADRELNPHGQVRKSGENRQAFEARLRDERNGKRTLRREAMGKQDQLFQSGLEKFRSAKSALDHLDSILPGVTNQQNRRDLVANVNEAIRKAENRQQRFTRIATEPWQKGRKHMPCEWENCVKGGANSFFPRYLLSVKPPVVKVEGDGGTDTDATTDFEDEGESALARVNVGAVRCAFRVSLPNSADTERKREEDRCWNEFKALMSPHPVTVRVYVLDGVDLRALGGGNSSSSYLVATLGKQKFDTKKTCVNKTLNPSWREFFEFETVFPGAAVLKLQVKHHSRFSADKDLVSEPLPYSHIYSTRAVEQYVKH